MDRLPRLTAKQIIPAIERAGFRFVRQSGSHMIFRNDQGKRITIPFHTGKTLGPKYMKSILQDTELNEEEFRKLL